MASRHAGWILAVAVAAHGCGDGRSYTSPTTPSLALPPAPGGTTLLGGQIGLAALTPAPGATIEVFDCDPTLPMASSRPAHVIGICTYALKMEVDVEVEQAVARAVLTVTFHDGDRRCAVASTGGVSLAPGPATRLVLNEIVLSDDPRVGVPCVLPVTTTGVVVQLVTGSGELRREFDHAYTFRLK